MIEAPAVLTDPPEGCPGSCGRGLVNRADGSGLSRAEHSW